MEYVFIIVLKICTFQGCTEIFTDNIQYKTEKICFDKALEKSVEISEELVNYKEFDGIMYAIQYNCEKELRFTT
jgi:hypothetical protein|tara:strand:- start:52 stop:273 length:222 start_codon:yes stop_codon:yes gene_type:complete